MGQAFCANAPYCDPAVHQQCVKRKTGNASLPVSHVRLLMRHRGSVFGVDSRLEGIFYQHQSLRAQREGTIARDRLLSLSLLVCDRRESSHTSAGTHLPDLLSSFPRQKLKLGTSGEAPLHGGVYFQTCFLSSNVPQAFPHGSCVCVCECVCFSIPSTFTIIFSPLLP